MTVPEQCLMQAEWCARLGSPLYAHLLTRCAEDYERGGPVIELLSPHAPDDPRAVLPLRMMGAVHRLVLQGRAPDLAQFYPSAGGTVVLDAAWDAFRRTLLEHIEPLRVLVRDPVQTNDAGRSGSLLGGFLLIADRSRLPLRLLEIGASGGLNLCWDRYRYEWTGGGWGDPASPVRLENVFVDGSPNLPDRVIVTGRAGCDPRPVDVHSSEGRLTLLAYTWADQIERIQRLEAAISVARTVPYRVEQSSAADWLEGQLAARVTGIATVVFHSIVWLYLSDEERERVTRIIGDAGASATADAPLAWLRMERGGEEAEVRLRIYPGFPEQVIAATGFHAPAVRWLVK